MKSNLTTQMEALWLFMETDRAKQTFLKGKYELLPAQGITLQQKDYIMKFKGHRSSFMMELQ